MKSVLIWWGSVATGVLLGFGASFLIDINIYLLIVAGVIVGSSVGITWNIHREREEDLEEKPPKNQNNTKEISPKQNTNQTAS